MTQHITMNTVIHAAFRRDLVRFDQALAAFPAGSRARADQLWSAWSNFDYQLHHHHQDEETIFWPAFKELGADDSLVGDLDGEHARMIAILKSTTASMESFHADPSADKATAARAGLADLSRCLLKHLEHEERDLEPFVAPLVGTPRWQQTQKEVRKAHKGNTGTFLAWLSDGADSDARAMLAHEIPAPVRFIISRTASRKYNRTIAPVWS